MKRISFLVIMAYIGAGLHSQQYNCNCDTVNGTHDLYLQNILISHEYYNPIQYLGRDQYFNTWTSGTIKLINGETIDDIMLMYDKYQDELLWLRQGDFKTGVVDKAIVKGFDIYDPDHQLKGSFIKKEIKLLGKGLTNVYLQVLVEGAVNLYVFRNVSMGEGIAIDHTQYYLEIDSNYYSVPIRRRGLIKTPGIDKEVMRNIIRSNYLSVYENEANFSKAVYLYNQAIP